jgi:hypothetical protein
VSARRQNTERSRCWLIQSLHNPVVLNEHDVVGRCQGLTCSPPRSLPHEHDISGHQGLPFSSLARALCPSFHPFLSSIPTFAEGTQIFSESDFSDVTKCLGTADLIGALFGRGGLQTRLTLFTTTHIHIYFSAIRSSDAGILTWLKRCSNFYSLL